jgi:hypothetical protein
LLTQQCHVSRSLTQQCHVIMLPHILLLLHAVNLLQLL